MCNWDEMFVMFGRSEMKEYECRRAGIELVSSRGQWIIECWDEFARWVDQSQSQRQNFSLSEEICLEKCSYSYTYMIKSDLLTCHQDHFRGGCIIPFLHKQYCNMKVIPHCKAIGNQRVLILFGCVERMDVYTIARTMLTADLSGIRMWGWNN